ncbi:MAG: hypothetical protein IPH21_02325 [Flavobacteriales bacterium]|nr:hypothetical protein [Flavobacteriales bacterium]
MDLVNSIISLDREAFLLINGFHSPFWDAVMWQISDLFTGSRSMFFPVPDPTEIWMAWSRHCGTSDSADDSSDGDGFGNAVEEHGSALATKSCGCVQQ